MKSSAKTNGSTSTTALLQNIKSVHHKLAVSTVSTVVRSCKWCRKEYPTKRQLKSHKTKRHKELMAEEMDQKIKKIVAGKFHHKNANTRNGYAISSPSLYSKIYESSQDETEMSEDNASTISTSTTSTVLRIPIPSKTTATAKTEKLVKESHQSSSVKKRKITNTNESSCSSNVETALTAKAEQSQNLNRTIPSTRSSLKRPSQQLEHEQIDAETKLSKKKKVKLLRDKDKRVQMGAAGQNLESQISSINSKITEESRHQISSPSNRTIVNLSSIDASQVDPKITKKEPKKNLKFIASRNSGLVEPKNGDNLNSKPLKKDQAVINNILQKMKSKHLSVVVKALKIREIDDTKEVDERSQRRNGRTRAQQDINEKMPKLPSEPSNCSSSKTDENNTNQKNSTESAFSASSKATFACQLCPFIGKNSTGLKCHMQFMKSHSILIKPNNSEPPVDAESSSSVSSRIIGSEKPETTGEQKIKNNNSLSTTGATENFTQQETEENVGIEAESDQSTSSVMSIANSEKAFKKCPVCSELLFYESTTDRTRYWEHVDIHRGLRPYVCPFYSNCRRSFANSVDLLSHSSCHHKNDAAQADYAAFECDLCQRPFPLKNAFVLHRKRCKGRINDESKSEGTTRSEDHTGHNDNATPSTSKECLRQLRENQLRNVVENKRKAALQGSSTKLSPKPDDLLFKVPFSKNSNPKTPPTPCKICAQNPRLKNKKCNHFRPPKKNNDNMDSSDDDQKVIDRNLDSDSSFKPDDSDSDF